MTEKGRAAKPIEPRAFMFKDDGLIPNNPHLPLLLYPGVFDLSGTAHPEEVIEALFRRNGWGEMWRNGIFPYVHYHSQIHEGLGIARGRARVRFGGAQGEEIEVKQGDFALLPAGTGHQCLWASPDLLVIGTYPPDGRYDLCRGSKTEHDKAVETIPQVPLPQKDPIYGDKGPALELWGK